MTRFTSGKLARWLAVAAFAALGTYAAVGTARFEDQSTNQEVTFKVRAGVRGVLDTTIRGTTGTVSASEKDGVVTFEVPVASLDTGNSARDRHLREVLAATKHETIELRVERDDLSNVADGEKVEGKVTGIMTIAGASESVPLKYRAKRQGNEYHVKAMFKLDIDDFGIEPPCKGPVCVDETVWVMVKSYVLRDR